MILLTPQERALIRGWFLPDRPGPLVGLHVIHTGHGSCIVDRWPEPRAAIVEIAGNYSLVGNPDAFTPQDLRQRLVGMVEAPDVFVPLLQDAFPDLYVWERVMFDLQGEPKFTIPSGAAVRRLKAEDAYHIWGLTSDSMWIAKTWGGPGELARSGLAWGAFLQGQLVSVACIFFVGATYEDLGVVTEPDFRGMGLSVACAGALCEDIIARGHRPSWTTSTDNEASQRVAHKLGFSLHRHDRLFVIGRPAPRPPKQDNA